MQRQVFVSDGIVPVEEVSQRQLVMAGPRLRLLGLSQGAAAKNGLRRRAETCSCFPSLKKLYTCGSFHRGWVLADSEPRSGQCFSIPFTFCAGSMPNRASDRIMARTVTPGPAASSACPQRLHLMTGGRMLRSDRMRRSILSSSPHRLYHLLECQIGAPADTQSIKHLWRLCSLRATSRHRAQS